VFGVKNSLMVDIPPLDAATAKDYLSAEEQEKLSDWSVLRYDFVLVTEKEASELRDRESTSALERLGMKTKIYEGLPVPDLD
jgi:hypothetical protein